MKITCTLRADGKRVDVVADFEDGCEGKGSRMMAQIISRELYDALREHFINDAPQIEAAGADELDDDHPLWLINEQIKGLLYGEGAGEDHEAVVSFLRATGLPVNTVNRMHEALAAAALRRSDAEAINNCIRAIKS